MKHLPLGFDAQGQHMPCSIRYIRETGIAFLNTRKVIGRRISLFGWPGDRIMRSADWIGDVGSYLGGDERNQIGKSQWLQRVYPGFAQIFYPPTTIG